MAADAVGALGDMRDSNSDQLLCLRWQRTVGKHALAEGAKGPSRFGSEPAPPLAELGRRLRIQPFAFRHLPAPGCIVAQ